MQIRTGGQEERKARKNAKNPDRYRIGSKGRAAGITILFSFSSVFLLPSFLPARIRIRIRIRISWLLTGDGGA
jgi:hypothetical protein